MTITLKIDNSEIEKELKKIIQQQKVITLATLKKVLNNFDDNIKYPKKDPKKHSKFIDREYSISDVEDTALGHIKNSAKFIHDLRRES